MIAILGPAAIKLQARTAMAMRQVTYHLYALDQFLTTGKRRRSEQM